MKYSHKVKFGGKYYQVGEEVPTEATEARNTVANEDTTPTPKAKEKANDAVSEAQETKKTKKA